MSGAKDRAGAVSAQLQEVRPGGGSGQVTTELIICTSSCGLGQSDAARLAATNGASLTNYCYNWQTDEANMRVRAVKALSGGQRSQAAATAKTGVPWGECALSNPPSPPPTTKPSPNPTLPTSSYQLAYGPLSDTRLFSLVDAAHGKTYYPLTYAPVGQAFNTPIRCLCSDLPSSVDGTGQVLYAVLPALPDGTTSVNVAIPGFTTMKSVKVTS
ncbi:hypothetical protein [Leekyejoonella antrihumi]|uniref:Uncharacterized protein n=1 Tax=Leekyejoonella antrihumi TaxID=1660198 RepID=A0A563E145_9MICO|nr:hypothetical protein [Leekyejoonella antrihumi]TWP35953.1 hypothetical protein FGL98_12025 [Leekyejoonella antrihumi]